MKIGFFKHKIFCVLCLLAFGIVFGQGLTTVQAAIPQSTENREVLNMNTDWLYSDTEYANGEAVGLKEDTFVEVSVPHANKILDMHVGNDFPSAIGSYRFVSWYRRHFTLPKEYEGKRILIDFEGVATVADVYVNGKHLTNHKGAYTGFQVDITDEILWGEDNVLAVKVDSTRQTEVPPEGGNVDYCVFGGIVRDVYMTIVDPVYVERTYVTTPGLAGDDCYFGADVAIKETDTTVKNQIYVKNTALETKTYTVEIEVVDAEGFVETSASVTAEILAGANQTVTLETEELEDVHLWDIDDPYLYTMVTRIKDGTTVLDTHKTKFGMRKFGFIEKIQAPYGDDDAIDLNADGSFYLNGEKLEIRGINRHEQWPWIGRAVPDKLQAQDADLIKATGINAVRCSHYPQDPSFLDRCDEIGLLVFEEPPGWQHIGGEEWKENFKTNLEEMILRDRNHPSIVSWGVTPNESTPDVEYNRECEAISKALDPTRPTHGVRKREDYPYNSSNENYEVVADIFTPNYTYPNSGFGGNFAPAGAPRAIPYMVTEHVFDWWDGSFPDANEANTLKYIDTWAKELNYFYANSTVAGGFGWSMFDYNNEVNYTNTGYVFRSGLYDFFRQEKPAAYLYESQWDADDEDGPGAMIYIANKWGSKEWKLTASGGDSRQRIYVFSNCEEVELFWDETSLGKIKPNKYTSLPHPVFEYTVPSGKTYGVGDLKAVGYIDGVAITESERREVGAAVRLEVEADYTTLVADGTDMTSVSVRAVDAEGNYVPYAANVINVTQTDGVETTLISEKDVKLEGGRLAFLVQSKRDKTGTATFKVESVGLESAECTITINAYKVENVVPVPSVIAAGTIEPGLAVKSTINDSEKGDKNYRFNFQGSWESCSQEGAYENDNTYSNVKGDTCTITFKGAQIRYYGAKADAHGIVSFRVDDGEEVRVDCYATNRQDNVLLFDSGYLPRNKEHTLTVTVTGEQNKKATGCYVNADRVEISERKVVATEYAIDDSNVGTGLEQFSYSKEWTVDSDTNDSWTNAAGATVTFRFEGTRLQYVAKQAGHHGTAEMSIDGGEPELVDFYGNATNVLLYDTGELNPGEHELTVVATGEKNPAATDAYIVVEKVIIYKDKPNYTATISKPIWLETLGWTVDFKNTGEAGLDAAVLIAGYDVDGKLADKAIKDFSGDNYIEVNEEKRIGANLGAETVTQRGFIWDSEDYHPLDSGKAVSAEGQTELSVIVDNKTLSVKATVADAALKGSDISLMCFNPLGDGSFVELNKNANALVFLNQYTMDTDEKAVEFKLHKDTPSGTYYLVIGTVNGMVTKSFTVTNEAADSGNSENIGNIGNVGTVEYPVLEETIKAITSVSTDKKDVAGSRFAGLQLKAVGKNKSVKLSWKKLADADGYVIFGAADGKTMEQIADLSASKKSYTAKKLSKGKYYKYIVVAYENIEGKKCTLEISSTVHASTKGGKFGNPTAITYNKKKVTVKTGKTYTLKPKLKTKGKVKTYIAKLRYESSNSAIVTVNKNGKIKAMQKGSCEVYIYAQNGISKKVKLTVK